MKTMLNYIKCSLLPVLLFSCLAALGGCSDDEELLKEESNMGFLQFRLYKQAERAATANKPLETLYEAKKIKVVLIDEHNNVVSQTLDLVANDVQEAEYGINSSKLELLKGDYRLTGFYLYDAKEEVILVQEFSEAPKISILEGGLTKHELFVQAVAFGQIKFVLKKNILQKKEVTAPSIPFRLINTVDITLRNNYTKEKVRFQKLPVDFVSEFDGEAAGSALTSFIEVDSIVTLVAGRYSVVEYALIAKGGMVVYDRNSEVAENEFVVAVNEKKQVDVLVDLFELAPNMQDYIALKAIWEALDGEKWSYEGQTFPTGINWDFNKDMDMWGEQPGVRMDVYGRITGLTIGGFGPRGEVPDEIGLLTELETLILGDINDNVGNFTVSRAGRSLPLHEDPYTTEGEESSGNKLYYERYVKRNPAVNFSEVIQEAIAEDKGIAFKLAEIELPDLYPRVGVLTNQITKVSDEIKNLKKLRLFSIANSPITEIPDALDQLPKLTDVQVSNCPNITTFPSVISRLNELVALNMAFNPQISHEEMYKGLDDLANFEGAKQTKTLQLLYMGYNKLTTLPSSFSKLERLGAIDFVHNELEVIPAWGANVSPVQVNLSHNKIHTIERGADGVFCDMRDMETFAVNNNLLTKFPDIFDKDAYSYIPTVDLSNNLIEDVQTERGIRVETLSLAGNKLTEYPATLFLAGSRVKQLSLTRNQIKEFPEQSFTGEHVKELVFIDLTFNHLSKIPVEFNASTVPYLAALDLSYNRFDHFPRQALNPSGLAIFALRYQRDVNGYRCMKEWPMGVDKHLGLRRLWLGGNDIGVVSSSQRIGNAMFFLDVSDNPKMSMDMSSICSRLAERQFILIHDPTQNLYGCPYLNLE